MEALRSDVLHRAGPPYRVRQDQGPRLAKSKAGGLDRFAYPVPSSKLADGLMRMARTHPLIPLDIALRTFEVRVQFFPFGVVNPISESWVGATIF